MCKVFTANIRKYKGTHGLDITIGSGRGIGLELFTPPNKTMVNRVIGNRQSPEIDTIWAEYKTEFFKAMRARYKAHPQKYVDFLMQHDEVTLLCYCQIGQLCHRDLVTDILEKIAQFHGLPFERGGIR